VQVLLRHQNLATTEIYTLVTAQRRATDIELLDPFRVGKFRHVTTAALAEALGPDLDEECAE
jgi:hypothetical protein